MACEQQQSIPRAKAEGYFLAHCSHRQPVCKEGFPFAAKPALIGSRAVASLSATTLLDSHISGRGQPSARAF
jgi:hypothetical protein